LQLPLLHRAMEFHFLGEVGLEAPLPGQEPQPSQESWYVGLRCVEDLVDGEDQAIEFVPFGRELLAAGGGERVEARASVVFRYAPLRFHPAVEQQALQRWIQGAFPDLQYVVRHGAEMLGDAVAVHRTSHQALQNEQVERAWKKVRSL